MVFIRLQDLLEIMLEISITKVVIDEEQKTWETMHQIVINEELLQKPMLKELFKSILDKVPVTKLNGIAGLLMEIKRPMDNDTLNIKTKKSEEI